jgi:hypothetical protein
MFADGGLADGDIDQVAEEFGFSAVEVFGIGDEARFVDFARLVKQFPVRAS